MTVNGSGNNLVFGSFVLDSNGTAETTDFAGTGNVTINGAVTFPSGGNAADAVQYSGTGTGTLTLLSNGGNYTGGTTLSSGTLVVGASTVSGTTITSGPIGKERSR